MIKTVACTICSKEKDPRRELIPARQRYLGAHVSRVAQLAHDQALLFYILSGKFGLISADKRIENYDYLLEASEVNALAEKVAKQLESEQVGEVRFYYQPKPGWRPYLQALSRATFLADVTFETIALALDDTPTLSPA